MDLKGLTELLAELVSINSINPAYDPASPGEGPIARYVADWLRGHGVATELQEVLPGRFNVIGRVAGHIPGRARIFDEHLDTVSVLGMKVEPFRAEIRNGRMFGRGTCDTKGGLAAMLFALSIIAARSEPPPVDVWVTGTAD